MWRVWGRIEVHRVLVRKPEGKRPLGRSRRRWEDIMKDLQEVGGGRGNALEYLIHALQMAYIDTPRQNEPSKAFRHRIYETVCTTAMAENVPREMRLIQIHPTTDWTRVWEKLHATWASDNKLLPAFQVAVICIGNSGSNPERAPCR
jgi:hypothetical protein